MSDSTLLHELGEIGRFRFSGQTEDEVREIKERFANTPGAKVNKKSVSFDTLPTAGGSDLVQEVPVKKINTDTDRFQNRDTEYSEESVNRIVNNFDPNKFDPITVWVDPENGKTYVLSGHSRLAAFKLMKAATIPAKYFQGSEEEAIIFAKVDANRGGTAESLTEDIKAYKLLKERGKTKKELKARFPNAENLEAYSYLDPNGSFIKVLNDPVLKANTPYAEIRSAWVGMIRRNYPTLTNAHEDEIFRYLYIDPPSQPITKDNFHQLIYEKVARFDFDPSQPLLLKGGNTGTQARADTSAVERRKMELVRENKKLSEALKMANTSEEKRAITLEIQNNLVEIERINRDLNIMLKSQSALFGRSIYTGDGAFPYTPENDPRRPTYTARKDWGQLITPAENGTESRGEGTVKDTITAIKEAYRRSVPQVRKLAAALKDPNGERAQTLHNVWHWVKTHISYTRDPRAHEQVRTASRSWLDRFKGVDCEDYSILIAAILTNLGFNAEFRIVGMGGGNYSHIFAATEGHTLDACLWLFDVRPPKVTAEMKIDVLTGIETELNPPLLGLGSTDATPQPKNITALVKAEQSRLLATPNPNAAELRKLNWIIQMENNPEFQIVAFKLAPVVTITPAGEVEPKAGMSKVDLAKLTAMLLLNADGKLGAEHKTELKGDLGEIEAEIRGYCGADGLGAPKWLKNIGRKIKRGFQKAVKTVGKEVKKFAKNPLRYAATALMKINPLFIIGRNAFLLCLRINLFGFAKKLSDGLLNAHQAKQKGMTGEQWMQAKQKYGKFSKAWELPFGGSQEALKKAVMAGAKMKPLTDAKNVTADHKNVIAQAAPLKGFEGMGDTDGCGELCEGMALGEPISLSVIIATAGSIIGTAAGILGKVASAKESVERIASKGGGGGSSDSDEDDDEDVEGLDELGKLTKEERAARKAARKAKRAEKKAGRKGKKKKGKKAKKPRSAKDKASGKGFVEKVAEIPTGLKNFLDNKLAPIADKLGLNNRSQTAQSAGFASEAERQAFFTAQNTEAQALATSSETGSKGGNNTMIYLLVGGGALLALTTLSK